jgi:hypothetical protein
VHEDVKVDVDFSAAHGDGNGDQNGHVDPLFGRFVWCLSDEMGQILRNWRQMGGQFFFYIPDLFAVGRFGRRLPQW